MTMKRNIAIGVFAAVAVPHLIIQFVTWSFAPGNAVPAAPSSFWQTYGWKIISFPIFWLLPQGVATDYFWITCILNSVVWAVLIAVGAFYLLNKRSQTK